MIKAYEVVSNLVKAQDATIYSRTDCNRLFEVRDLRKSLVAREKHHVASLFMQMELNLVRNHETNTSVGAALQLCQIMTQKRNNILLFRSVKLSRQLSAVSKDYMAQFSEQLDQQATALAQELFSDLENEWPAIFFDRAINLIKVSDLSEAERYRKLIDLSNSMRRQKDFNRTNNTLIKARDAALKHYEQSRLLPSGRGALEDLRTVSRSHAELHRYETGMEYFESAATTDYMTSLFVHSQDYQGVLQTLETFQEEHRAFELANHHERRLDMAILAAKKLGYEDQAQRYTAQHFYWLKQCPFSERWGQLKDSVLSDPDQYIRQMCTGSADLIEWGNNAVALILTLTSMEWRTRSLSTSSVHELLQFALKLEEDKQDTDSLEEILASLDFEDAARNLFGTNGEPAPHARFIETMERLKQWLSLPDKLPSQAARLGIAKIIMQSRLYRVRLHLATKGLPDDVDTKALSLEQQFLDEIEELEHEAGGGRGDFRERQISGKIQTTLNKCYVPDAAAKGLISDKELESRIADCTSLASRYAKGGQRFSQYHILCQQGRLHWQRYLHFRPTNPFTRTTSPQQGDPRQWQQYLQSRSVSPDAGMKSLEHAELLFNEMRRGILSSDFAQSFTSSTTIIESLKWQEHSKLALAATLQAFWGNLAAAQESQSMGYPQPQLFEDALKSYNRFLEWTYRSKGRILIDLFVREQSQKASDTMQDSTSPGTEASLSTAVQGLQISNESANQNDPEQTAPHGSSASVSDILSLSEAEQITSKTTINRMLDEVDQNVVLVDIINIPYLAKSGSQAILYRRGTPNVLPIPLPDLTLRIIEAWAVKHFGTSAMPIKEPLKSCDSAEALAELTPLIMPLFHVHLPQHIKANEIIVFCLTGALHQIPIHAIPIGGVPLIEQNPIVYCPSLTTLHHGYEAISESSPSSLRGESIAILPSYKEPWIDDANAERSLQERLGQISGDLNAERLTGSSLTEGIVQASLSKRSHIHYFGHVHYDSGSPLRTALLLNDAAFKDPSLMNPASEGLTVRNLLKPRLLQSPSLVTLIGCGSGQNYISSSDDILGLTSAFIFAGTSAVVSTLWPISPEDGADFSIAFYRAYRQHEEQQKQKQRPSPTDKQDDENTSTTTTDTAKASKPSDKLKKCINLALVMQDAIRILRNREPAVDTSGKDDKMDKRPGSTAATTAAPYHWAAFYFTGFWMFPSI